MSAFTVHSIPGSPFGRAVLATTEDLRDSTINVDVDNAVVTLSGTVANAAQKSKAEQVARGVTGPKGNDAPRTSRPSSHESNCGQSDWTMFSPVEGLPWNCSISRSRCLFCHGAKAEAVAGGVGIVFAPMAVGLAIIDLRAGIIALCGIAVAGAAATLIQFWFRAQVKRSLFRRRHVSSRVATFAEALSSIIWAGAGAIAAVNLWVAIVPGALALFVLGGAWMLSPKRA